jgi:hypothetical protein
MRLAHFLLLVKTHKIFSWKILNDGNKTFFLFKKLFKLVDIFTTYQSQYLTFLKHQTFCASLVFIFFIYDLSCKLFF